MSYVYFLERHLGGLIKIGYSKRPVERMAIHRLAFGRMNLLGIMPGGRKEEKRVHSKFSHLQKLGHKSIKRQHMQEFFEPGAELIRFIEDHAGWADVCEEMKHELTREFSYTRSHTRAKSVLKAINEGFGFSEIARAYDVGVDGVLFFSENPHMVSFCRL